MTDRPPALLAVGHGSRDPRAAAVATALLDQVRRARPHLDVSVAFLDHVAPDVPAALAAAGARGARAAVVVPLLLTEAYHTRVDLPAVLRAPAGAGAPPTRQACALGPHPLLLRTLERRLREAGVPAGDPDTAVVLAAAGSSDPGAVATVEEVARTWAATGWFAVRAAYAAAAQPTVGAAIAGLRAAGAPRVVVAPYVLAPGLLPDRIADAAAAADVLAEPLGAAPEIADLVLRRFDETA